jgi:hypothetical protein
MRLWTLHPKYLDVKGLVAVWREALLAQKVLQGKTQGYRSHPQLVRFKNHPRPVAVISTYLTIILKEAKARGYQFDERKISGSRFYGSLVETDGQLLYEWHHLKRKLRERNYQKYLALRSIVKPKPNPLFKIIPGSCQKWERRKK